MTPGGEPGPPARTRHTARRVALVVLVVSAGLIAVLATRPPATLSEVANPLVGRLVPRVEGTTTAGARYTMPDPPGRYLVINFFASWCEPCQVEGPELVRFEFQHRQRGDATLLSVVFDDTVPAATSSQAQLGATWPTLVDPGGRIALDFGVRAPPTTFVVAPDGRVVASIIAPVTAADLDTVIARARASGA